MKKNLLICLLLIVSTLNVFGQNVFPESGNVGLGTLSPSHALHIVGRTPNIWITNRDTSESGIVFKRSLTYNNQDYRIMLDGNDNSLNFKGHFGASIIKMTSANPFFLSHNQIFYGSRNSGVVQTIYCPRANAVTYLGTDKDSLLGIEIGIYDEPYIGARVNNLVEGGSEAKLRLTSSIQIKPKFNNTLNLFDIISTNVDMNEVGWTLHTDTLFHVDKDISYFTKPVGIGTSTFPKNAKQKLFVKGGIVSEEVKVNIAAERGWGDYVFHRSYRLMPLYELEHFIKRHKHLPEIPTAEEVHREGIEVGEMTRLQMVKIEELTLYIIEQQKMLDAQNKRIEHLERQMKGRPAKKRRG